MLLRYRNSRPSSLSLYKRSSSSSALSKLAYHTARKATLEPMSDAKSTPSSARSDSEPIDDLGVPQFLTTVELVHHKHHRDIQIEMTPPLPPEPSTEEDFALIEKKLKLCCIRPDFTDPEADRDGKAKKSAMLRELANVFGNEAIVNTLPGRIIDSFFDMINTNLFRGIPQTATKFLVYDDEPCLIDIAWPHLNLVYALFHKYFAIRPKDKHFDLKYERRLLGLFAAPDPNERDNVLNFFRAYVSVYPERERAIWIRMGYMLIQYKERTIEPYVVTPILLFLHGRFRDPKSDVALSNHLLRTSIMPLISARHILTYYVPLTEVFKVFIDRDQSIAYALVMEAIKRWPEAKPSKQIIFINMINLLTEKVSLADFEQLAVPLFTLYARLARVNSAKIVDASFRIWQNVQIIPMIIDNTKLIFPMMHSALARTMKDHWNVNTQNGALNTLQSMHDLDPFIFEELNLTLGGKKAPPLPDPLANAAIAAHKNWAIVARLAAKRDKDMNLARALADIQVKFNGVQAATKSRSTTGK